jgi:metallophosphoesterase (TIGR00282 family)
MKILFLGDIVGRPGRRALERWLPGLRTEYGADVVIANAENAAGGLGVTPEILQELRACGVEGFTLGNHTWRKRSIVSVLDNSTDIVRPANYPAGVPGFGNTIITTLDGRKLGLLNLIGRVFMEPFECPFARALKDLAELREQTPVILLDMHGEATSEKIAMGWHVDGLCSAVVGTHTHVQTADERILPEGTAYITDVGMCGPRDSVIGVERQLIIEKFLTGMPREFKVARGPIMLSGVVIDVDDSSGRARSIQRVQRAEE